MSRKANNLRKRLRIQREQYARREREASKLRRDWAQAEQRVRSAEENTFAKSVMIRVEREWAQYARLGMYAASLQFSPQSYYRAIRREMQESGSFQDLSFTADEIGYRMGRMVTQAIMEHITKEMQGAGRGQYAST